MVTIVNHIDNGPPDLRGAPLRGARPRLTDAIGAGLCATGGRPELLHDKITYIM